MTSWSFRFGRYVFRPPLGFSLAALFGLAVTLGLAIWQLERLEWKKALIDARVSASSRPALFLHEMSDQDVLPYTRVRVRGVFRHDREMYRGALSVRGNPGYHVLTPLALESGGMILVNRGWVPLELKTPASRPLGQTGGTVEIEGVVRQDGRPGRFVPDNRPEEDFWFYVDLDAMSDHAGVGDLGAFYIDAGSQANDGGFPLGGQTPIHLRNDHLEYAITWFALALGLIGVYVAYCTRKEP